MKFFFILSSLIVLLSCSKKEPTDEWIGKKLEVPEIDNDQKKKVVIRFLGDCPSCIESIPAWEKVALAMKEKSKSVMIVFYVEVIKESNFESVKKQLHFADLVVFDQKGRFFAKNLISFPHPLEYQTFLLDKENRIMMYGSPALYSELIREYIDLI